MDFILITDHQVRNNLVEFKGISLANHLLPVIDISICLSFI